MTEKALVAVDLGGESCRVSLLRWQGGKPRLHLVHRFPNGPVLDGGRLYWNVDGIYDGVEKGIRLCAEIATEGIASIGVDGWGVDYVRLQPDRKSWLRAFCYRDERTVAAEEEVHRKISRERLYELTGIQFLRINTLYQLYADFADGVDQRLSWLQIPEFLTYRLGGEPVCEFTNVTHSALVGLKTHDWCDEVFQATGVDRKAAQKIVYPGYVAGRLKPDLAGLPALRDAQLIVPACHDTASAIAGIPDDGKDWAFISSGTWSLVGTVLDSPFATPQAREKNFTNLGGAGGKTCFLRNVNGMWLLRQCLDQWKLDGIEIGIQELIEACAALPAPDHLIHVDDPEFLLPGDLPSAINARRKAAGFAPIPTTREGVIRMAGVVLHSLAERYKQVLGDVTAITGKKLRRLYVVGGGGKNTLLNRLTEQKTGLQVVVGSPESSTVGNFAIQLASLRGGYAPAVGVDLGLLAKFAAELVPCTFETGADSPSIV